MAKKMMGLKAWVDHLSNAEMPALATVIKELNELTEGDDVSVNQLSDAILKDANLTSKVLRIANSVHYNPSRVSITTISRAVVLIGFSSVRAISISALIIDALLGPNAKECMMKTMAQAFHAATQAKKLCPDEMGEDEKEEVFIAALLYHLGEMAFWSCNSPQVEELAVALSDPGANKREVSEELIGVNFRVLSKGLSKQWSIGGVLQEALEGRSAASPAAQAVMLGQEVSHAALQGWDSGSMEKVMEKIVKFTNVSPASAKELVFEGAEEAASVATTFGAARVCQYLPSVDTANENVAEGQEAQEIEPDAALQLQVLRDLSSMVKEKVDINMIFQLVLEGMHRGIGLERVVVAILDANRKGINAKYIIGDRTTDWRDKFRFPVNDGAHNVFSYVLKTKEPVWLGTSKSTSLNGLRTPPITDVVGTGQFFVAPICIGPKEIGVFYVDKGVSKKEIKEDQWQSFLHFVQQTNMCLAVLAGK